MGRLEITRFPALDYACNEAINALCTNVTFVGESYRKIMVTSCQASEGKSFLTMNMLRTMAGLGKKVVLVDADLRRSMLESRYGLEYPDGKRVGLAHYLAGMAGMEQVLFETNIPGAYMVPVGREVSNSLSLLSGARFTRLLDQLATHADLVLVDAPPVGVIIDAAEIAKSCDGTLLAVHYNRISRRELQEAKNQIERTGCPILGAVLNSVTFDTYSSKKYYYKGYYSQYDSDYYGKTEKPMKDRTAGAARKPAGNKAQSGKARS